MNRDDYRHLLLAGTVTFPATFPQLGRISLVSELTPIGVGEEKQQEVLSIDEFPSAKVTISRKVFVDKVRAVFIPQDPRRVSYDSGTWILAEEIAAALRGKERVLGIVFVQESESTLLEVRAGMTAAESAQYYPPLPNDRSFNHYGGTTKRQMMSGNVGDDSNPTSNFARTLDSPLMAAGGLGDEFFFSCDGPDIDEMLSCDGPDVVQMFSCDGSDLPCDS